MAVLDVNNHLAVVGNMGRQQWLQLFLIGFIVITFGWQMFVTIFTHKTPNFRCIDEDNYNATTSAFLANVTFDNACEVASAIKGVNSTRKCTRFAFEEIEFEETVIEKFDLVCDRAYLSMLTEMIYMGVAGIGTIGGSYFGDRFGRKPIMVVGAFATGVLGLIQAFSVNLIMYTTLRCLNGILAFGAFTPAFSLLLESVKADKRAHCLNSLEIFWIFGVATLSLFGYLLASWWKLQIVISAPSLILGLSYIWFLDESPHWLATTGKTKQALMLLQKMGRRNNVDMDGLSFDENDFDEHDTKLTKEEASQDSKTETFIRIWRHKRLVARFMVFNYGWVVCNLCYYALSFGVRDLPGNIFVNNLVSSIVEGIGYVLCFGIAWWGRKWPTVASFSLAGSALLVSVLVTAFSPESSIVVTAMSMIGKMFVTAAWQIIIVWSGELYPTSYRCTLASINTIIGRVGSLIAPFMLDLHKYIELKNEELIMPIVFVVLMAIGGLTALLPPETNKRKLPEFIKDANKASFPMDEGGDEVELEEAEKDDLLQKDLEEKHV